jgi:hypothetical protein
MSQHIGIQVVDERFNLLTETRINFSKVIKLLYKLENSKRFILLNFIDPYGLTLFNFNQSRILLIELFELIKETTDKENLKTIFDSCELLSNMENHQLIKFIGD